MASIWRSSPLVSWLCLRCPNLCAVMGQDPHFTQGLFKCTITSFGEQPASHAERQVKLQGEDAPLPGHLVLYSTMTCRPLRRVPRASQQLAKSCTSAMALSSAQ